IILGKDKDTGYWALKKAVMNLFRAEWGYKKVNEKGNVVVAYERFTQSAKYIQNEGIVKFKFADAIVPFLVELEKHFTVC
ncbi:replication initiation protein, partial [Kingella kingae]|uniref:replication initiation protein n=1 Tax=Kingella kingae TaxID=504 RepID=UPI002553074B